MTLILETGNGVPGANSYVTPSFVTTYLTDRGREAENSWSTSTTAEQEDACVAATDYIDTRWGSRFKGVREYLFEGEYAQGVVEITDVPAANDTLTVGERTYTFVASLDEYATDEVLIGATAAATASALISAVAAESSNAGTLFSSAQFANRSVTASLKAGTTDTIVFTSTQRGESGNDIPLSRVSPGSDITLLTASFVFGRESGVQPLEFPRAGLYVYGERVTGVPIRLKQAAAEYAVRARSAALYADPVVDDTGRAVTFRDESVGPLKDITRYEDGAGISALIKPYPAADNLLEPLVKPAGGTWR